MNELKKEYANQDNRSTRWPIYVTVQELKFVGVIDDQYSSMGVDKYEKSNCELCDDSDDCDLENNQDQECTQKEIKCGYVWQDIEMFLTIKGAKEFIEADKHNHGELRTFVKHFSRRNFEMNDFIKNIGFKYQD